MPQPVTEAYDVFFNDLQTGDIILMHGLFHSSVFIETITGCNWSHAAIAVLPNDVGIADLPQGTVLLWESNIKDPNDNNVEDVILNETKNGPMLVKLKERITNNYQKQFDRNVAKRKLNFTRTPQLFNSLKLVIQQVHLFGFPEIPDGEMGNYVKGLLHQPVTDGTFFCSQLVAHTYKAFQLLTNEYVDNSYSPADFAQGPKSTKLQQGATLNNEIQIDINTIPAYPG